MGRYFLKNVPPFVQRARNSIPEYRQSFKIIIYIWVTAEKLGHLWIYYVSGQIVARAPTDTLKVRNRSISHSLIVGILFHWHNIGFCINSRGSNKASLTKVYF